MDIYVNERTGQWFSCLKSLNNDYEVIFRFDGITKILQNINTCDKERIFSIIESGIINLEMLGVEDFELRSVDTLPTENYSLDPQKHYHLNPPIASSLLRAERLRDELEAKDGSEAKEPKITGTYAQLKDLISLREKVLKLIEEYYIDIYEQENGDIVVRSSLAVCSISFGLDMSED